MIDHFPGCHPECAPSERRGTFVPVGLPPTLERLDPWATYRVDDDDALYGLAYLCPDPDLTGDAVDAANVYVLTRRDDADVTYYRHWTWRHYVVILLPEGAAREVRAALAEYPVLDDEVLSVVELAQQEDDS